MGILVNQPTSEIAEIRAAASVLIERMQFMRQAGISFKGERDLYDVLGYDRLLTPQDYRDRYARGGVTKRIVEAFPKATWRGGWEVIEDENPTTETEFEKAWNEMFLRLSIGPRLQRADILAGLSTFSVILLGSSVAGDLSSPLPKGSPEQLAFLAPFIGGGDGRSTQLNSGADCTIQSYVEDVKDSRFGLPLTYQLRRTNFAAPMLATPVHWSRIIHIAEGCLEDDVFGIPVLESVWNLLDDLDKVTGGGAEAFWLRANQGIQLDVNKDINLTEPDREALRAQADEYKHNISRMMRTRGVTVNTLGSDVANFANPADAILTQISGAKGIPKRILTGSEMGELASSQDRDNWKDQINGRQTEYVAPFIIRPLVDRLIKYGYLPEPKDYQVIWPHIQTLSEQEKADGAAKWATVVVGGQPVFLPEEIRDKWYGMEPLTPEQLASAAPPAPPEEVKPPEPEEKPTPKTAAESEDAELIRVLEAAIVADNTEVIDRIIGVRRPEPAAPAPVILSAAKEVISKRIEYDANGRVARIVHEKGAVA